MFCKNCGKKIPTDSLFCSFCGKKQGFENMIPLNETLKLGAINQIQSESNIQINESAIPKILESEKQIKIQFVLAGVAFLLFYIILYFTPNPPYVDEETSKIERIKLNIMGITYLIFRGLMIYWVVNNAVRQKRNSLIWGLSTGFFPSIALIIFGLTSRRYKLQLTRTVKAGQKE